MNIKSIYVGYIAYGTLILDEFVARKKEPDVSCVLGLPTFRTTVMGFSLI